MARLQPVDWGPGIRRRRRGRSFSYEDTSGAPIGDPEVPGLTRERVLACATRPGPELDRTIAQRAG
jgi:hypothetical protein